MENIKVRIYKFDNVKLLAILLVVIGHVAESFTSGSDMFRSWFVFVYSFHAPLFIFLCGLFQKKYSDTVKFNIQKFCFYIILGFFLKLLLYFSQVLTGTEASLDLFGGYTVEWFLFVVAFYSLIAFLIRKLNPTAVLICCVAFGLLIGFFPVSDEFYLSRFFVFSPFYFAGYYLSPITVRKFAHKTAVKFISIAFMFIYFVMCFRQREIIYPFRELFTGRNPYAVVSIDGCTFYHRLLCYLISTALIIAVLAAIPNVKVPVLTRMGQNTLGVYFWHYPIIIALNNLGLFAFFRTLGDPLWKLVVLAFAVLLGLVLTIPIFSWPLKKFGAQLEKLPDKAALILTIVIYASAAAAWALQLFM